MTILCFMQSALIYLEANWNDNMKIHVSILMLHFYVDCHVHRIVYLTPNSQKLVEIINCNTYDSLIKIFLQFIIFTCVITVSITSSNSTLNKTCYDLKSYDVSQSSC